MVVGCRRAVLLDACHNLEHILEYFLFFLEHLLPPLLEEFLDVEPKVAVVVHCLAVRVVIPDALLL